MIIKSKVIVYKKNSHSLQHTKFKNYYIATGQTHVVMDSVKPLVEIIVRYLLSV